MRPQRKITMVKPASEMQSSINVTPLVDVVLVLLIIFMVVMPLLEKDFSVRIPTHEEVETPTEVPKEQIIVKLDRDGTLLINGGAVPRESYIPALKTRLSGAAQRTVFVSSHPEAAYPRLIEAFEGARSAGAETLAMLPELAEPAEESAAPAKPEAAAPASAPPQPTSDP